jgi:hypothetical protein
VTSWGHGSQGAESRVHVIALNKTEHTHTLAAPGFFPRGGGWEEGTAIKFAYKLASKQFRNVFTHRHIETDGATHCVQDPLLLLCVTPSLF